MHYNKEKLQTNISHKHRYKTPQQNLSKLNPTMCKRVIYQDQVEFITGVQSWFSI